MDKLFNAIAGKLFSGRYFLTICAGIVFVACSIQKPPILTPETIAVIITAVMKDYFSRSDRNGQNGANGTK